MSGGLYNYAYHRFTEFAHELAIRSPSPERKAFIKLVQRVAKAAKEIEWQDSGDGGNEDEAIKEALGEKHKELVLNELIEEAEALIKSLSAIIKNHKS